MGAASIDVYGRRALEAVARISATGQDGGSIADIVTAEMAWFGFDFVTSWTLPYVGGQQIETIDINTRPASYTDHYQRNKVLRRDPVVKTLRRTLSTMSWSDVRAERLAKPERAIIDEAGDFGAHDGLTIPVLSRSGCIGVFSPCGYQPDLSPRARDAVEMIGLYAHQAFQRLQVRTTRSAQAHRPLTPREREVIRWVAIGKTNEEIGSILGITAETVKTILTHASEKLDASRRTYAVVQAIRLGELDLNF